MEKILITGHKGFVGQHLIKSFKDAVGYDKQDGNDLTDAHQLDSFIGQLKPDIVIHLAANATVGASVLDDINDNVLATTILLEACKKHKVKKFIFASSAAVYGDQIIEVKEDAILEPISSYGITKRACEDIIKFICKTSKIKYCILRFSNIYGPNGRGVINKIMKNPYDPFTVNGGNQIRNFVYISDVIDAFKKAIDSEGIYNICDDKSLNIWKLISFIEKSGNFKLKTIKGKPLPDDIKDLIMLNTKAKEELYWRPKIGLKQGLKKLWNNPQK